MSNRPTDTIATLTICYRDSSGALTQRGVSVTEFDPYEMFGLCHLRNSYRTFLYERVTSCMNATTGEIVTGVHQHLMDTYCKTPLYALDQLERNDSGVLKVLLYVAKADGRMTAAERRIMNAACKVLTGDARITEELTDRVFQSMDTPSINVFKRTVGSLASRGDQALIKRLWIACNTMAKTEKSISAGEQEALDYMAKRFQVSQ